MEKVTEPVTSRAAPTKVISKLLPFRYCIALEQDDESLLVLGHQRRLPAASASLVEKIGKGIFILACMSGQLDHHSLVFFHQGLEIMSR
jgi:hypothetical protein